VKLENNNGLNDGCKIAFSSAVVWPSIFQFCTFHLDKLFLVSRILVLHFPMHVNKPREQTSFHGWWRSSGGRDNGQYELQECTTVM